ncbi:hypothetical protein [Gloeothece verrucosa]|uniref:Uncharacterized protein n=1 Tax=Gloeothece verrucosa (strain PCC 7822) TaxID=497965 RepID=E0UKM4_GLOV7|nr:hypothetical protein [Gloeothece verrucosa]ADN17504.1 conserved hypothetical protein [Gloeothece verrucosa PCC 7822]
MFPFCGNSYQYQDTTSLKTSRERKLQFLKWMRDSLEARLAGLNAMIETIERQLNTSEERV